MADEHIWIEVEGEDVAMVMLDAYTNVVKRRQKDLLTELAHDGVTFLEMNAPNYTGYTHRHIDKTPVTEVGDGFQATVGVKRGTSYHPVYANVGTGVFGPWSKQPYFAKNASGKMWFYSHLYNRVIGVNSVKGQRAQHFLYTTFEQLQAFSRIRMVTGAF